MSEFYDVDVYVAVFPFESCLTDDALKRSMDYSERGVETVSVTYEEDVGPGNDIFDYNVSSENLDQLNRILEGKKSEVNGENTHLELLKHALEMEKMKDVEWNEENIL